MLVLVLGFFLLIGGVLMMRNSELDRVLKQYDKAEWITVMRPSPSGYVNSFGVIPLFTWVLGRNYEKSASEEVRAAGGASPQRATLAKYCMLMGVTLISIGFALALFMNNVGQRF